ELERVASIPLIPGELEDWTATVGEALGVATVAYSDWLETQRALLHDIARRDDAMLHRVDHLEGRLLEVSAACVAHRRALAKVPISEHPHAYELAERVRHGLLSWIASARTLDRETTNWWLEAFYR